MVSNNARISSASTKWIISILLLSLILRWILIFRGGQYYNSDETRYEVSREAARFLVQGNIAETLKQFTLAPEHLGFKVIGLLPALVEQVTGPSLVMPAMFFSFFSVLNLYLIFLLSRATSESPIEPPFALAFAASSQSLLYYSRHLIPYDTSLSFGLLALYIPLVRDKTAKTSFLCGTLSFLAFITYNGYWPLAGFAMLVHTLMNAKTMSSILRKGMITGLGFVVPLGILIGAMLLSGRDMISAYQLFAASTTQGLFEEAWSIPFEYFWYAEGILFPILGALALLAVVYPRRDRRYIHLWAGGILFIYLCLVIPSAMKYFVVYGRLARQMLPFFALLAAHSLSQVNHRAAYSRQVTQLIFLAIVVQAAWNFSAAYRVGFPRDFATDAQVRFPGFEFSSKRLAYGAPVICQNNGYMIENTKFYVAPPERIPQVKGLLLLSAPHPSNFQPYLYEGDPPDFREEYRKLQLQMNFYKADKEFMSKSNPEWTSIENCVVHEN
ncbi:MAG TPA: hypothetical protein VIR02_04360 [Anaerolineales bacterium]